MKTLYVLTLIPAANFAPGVPELKPGALVRNVPEVITDKLVGLGFARLATLAEISGTADPVFWTDGEGVYIAAASKTKKGAIKVRLLSDSDFGRANSVVFMTPAEAKSAAAAGFADSDKDAVAYAESLQSADPGSLPPPQNERIAAHVAGDANETTDLSGLEVEQPITEKVIDPTAPNGGGKATA